MNTSTFFTLILPELSILLIACAILLIGVFSKNGAPRIAYYFSQGALIVALCLTLEIPAGSHDLYNMIVIDRLAIALKICILLAVMLTFRYADHYNRENQLPASEFYVLGLLSTIGMLLLVSTTQLLMLFLGLELMALPIYTMTAMMRGKMRSIEAGMKYFVIGAVASGLLLYGFSLLYGATRSMELTQMATVIATTAASDHLILYFGLIFVIAGIAFKLGAVPFHVWVPDVYDGSPNSTTVFISAAPKLAAFGFAARFFVDAAPQLQSLWSPVLIVIAILSIALGNIAGIIQTNIKRLLSYSSIAHIGYALLGLSCGTMRGNAAAFFYVITYTLMSVGAFGMLTLLSREGLEMNELSDFSGLAERQPWMAFMMLLIMFSLAGVPPLVGFMAKVGVLEALIEVHSAWLAVFAIIFSIIGAYYYIRVVKFMYFEDAATKSVVQVSPRTRVAITVNGLMILMLGVFPGQLFLLCRSVF